MVCILILFFLSYLFFLLIQPLYNSSLFISFKSKQSIGMDITHTGYRSAHALIGYKGAWPKNMRKSKSVSKSAVEVTYTFGKIYIIESSPNEGHHVLLAWEFRII